MSKSSLNFSEPVRRIITGHDSTGNASFSPMTSSHPTILTRLQPSLRLVQSQVLVSSRFIAPVPSLPIINVSLPSRIRHWFRSQTLKDPSCRIIDLPPAESGWFHRTLSLDYFVVLWGTVGFITDGGVEKVLNKGDVIVIRGTNHEWVNRGQDMARLFAVVIPSLKVVTEDGKTLEKTEAGPIYDPEEEDD